jgi:hypothetical protein
LCGILLQLGKQFWEVREVCLNGYGMQSGTAAGAGGTQLSGSTAGNTSGGRVLQPGGVVVQVELPDWSYSRLPADLTELVTGVVGAKPQAAAAAASDAAAGGGAAGAFGAGTFGTGAGTGSSSSSSTPEVVFELGSVLSDGSLARWLLCYDAAGGRLLQRATYELYPAAA